MLSPGAVMIMLAMPIVGFLLSRIEPRWLIVFSLVVCSIGLFMMSGFTTQTNFGYFVLCRCVQAGAIGFLFVPVNTAMYAYVPPGKNNNASALVNLAKHRRERRHLAVTTFLERRTQLHQSRLASHLTASNPTMRRVSDALSHYFAAHGGSGPNQQAHHVIYSLMQQQAGMLAYVDCYLVLSFAFALLIPFVFLLKPTRNKGMAMGH